MAAGIASPPTDAATVPGGMFLEHTSTGENAAPVLGPGLRHCMASLRPSATSDGQADPAGTTARATSPDGATDTGAASE
jgi:hypothetical protein